MPVRLRPARPFRRRRLPLILSFLVLASVVLGVYFGISYGVMRYLKSQRGSAAFLANSLTSYEFSGDSFRTHGLVSLGSILVEHPLPEVVVDREALQINLGSEGLPDSIGIRRSDVKCAYTRRGIRGVGFGFRDPCHRADGVTIWCGSRDPLWRALAERGWLTPLASSHGQ